MRLGDHQWSTWSFQFNSCNFNSRNHSKIELNFTKEPNPATPESDTAMPNTDGHSMTARSLILCINKTFKILVKIAKIVAAASWTCFLTVLWRLIIDIYRCFFLNVGYFLVSLWGPFFTGAKNLWMYLWKVINKRRLVIFNKGLFNNFS